MRNMANLEITGISDDEKFEIDSILDQRKRKGVLQYLVQWKEGDSTWEPAESIAADCTAAIEAFMKKVTIPGPGYGKQKSRSRRSSSKSRKSSRSRSRSHSRSRKASSTKAVRKSSRSRSRGRQTEEAEKTPTVLKKEGLGVIQTRRSLGKRDVKLETEVTKVLESKSSSVAATPSSSISSAKSSASSASTPVKTSPSEETKSSDKKEVQSERSLRYSTMETRKRLEVQRVHNEQRPIREDDGKPRSAIWRVADYAVIALFIISLLAAIFMFLEKFMDLENFKKQAFPSLETLSLRLQAAKDHLVDFFRYGWDRSSDAWDYILQQVKQPQTSKAAPS